MPDPARARTGHRRGPGAGPGAPGSRDPLSCRPAFLNNDGRPAGTGLAAGLTPWSSDAPPGIEEAVMRSARTTTVTLAAALTALVAGGAVAVASRTVTRPAYPDTPRGDTVDVWHGTSVPDPYRWLEQDPRSSADVTSWIAAENRVTAAWLAQVPEREMIHHRLEEVWNFERTTSSQWTGGRWFFTRNTGLQNQSVLLA